MNALTTQLHRSSVTPPRIDDGPRSTIQRVLREAGVPDDVAAGYAEMICREFSGEAIYFAVRSWTDTTQRNEEIRAQHAAGRSITWLAREYCLARSHVGRIVSTR